MASSAAYRSTRSWICRLVIRVVAALGAAATMATIVASSGTDIYPVIIVFAILFLWSFIDAILLCLRCIPHYAVNLSIDLIAALAALVMSALLFYMQFAPKVVIEGAANLLLPACLAAFTTIMHIVLFALSTKGHREARRDKHRRMWRPESYSHDNQIGVSLISMDYNSTTKSSSKPTTANF
ncbi:hypothetical protein NUU61_000138 [Penicillium alfredii]|uniref:MARVEL domain-containing protein n=1 Tax=Penicillium alfredii TaxID=1506179 RepID=A0A9W9G9E9_9EURO|nr:uncharacterized protein NUU61_000138 [Penicillium alfredii]KAJ5114379.1 hypothetical protein NUU61_000138 [Penicillium alfredii]